MCYLPLPGTCLGTAQLQMRNGEGPLMQMALGNVCIIVRVSLHFV